MRVVFTSKGMTKKFGCASYTLGSRYLSKNTVLAPTGYKLAVHIVNGRVQILNMQVANINPSTGNGNFCWKQFS